MKNTLLYLLLFTYSASILKPAIPYFSDTIAHTFYYAAHVKTVHFQNGKYHVHHELVKQATKGTNENGGCLKKISLPDDHLTVSSFFYFIDPYLHNIYLHFGLDGILPACKNAVFPPPRC